jgi:hypothetical protein
MPKRQRSGDHVDRRPGRESQRGLYLILDDWGLGYSIRKVDLLQSVAADVSGEVAPTIDRTEQPLPPALIRLEAPSHSRLPLTPRSWPCIPSLSGFPPPRVTPSEGLFSS